MKTEKLNPEDIGQNLTMATAEGDLLILNFTQTARTTNVAKAMDLAFDLDHPVALLDLARRQLKKIESKQET